MALTLEKSPLEAYNLRKIQTFSTFWRKPMQILEKSLSDV